MSRLVNGGLATGRLDAKQFNQIIRMFNGRALIGKREVVGWVVLPWLEPFGQIGNGLPVIWAIANPNICLSLQLRYEWHLQLPRQVRYAVSSDSIQRGHAGD